MQRPEKAPEMFERLGSKEVGNFAIELANEFSRRFPPDAPREGAGSAKGFARAVDEVCARAVEFQRLRRLGLYRKAKLGTEFKLRLKELGYAEGFVDELTHTLLIKMSGK